MDLNGVFHTIGLRRDKLDMIILFFFFAHWYLSLFFQTFFLHRYTSHKMFKMTPFWEKTFFLLTFIFQGSSFLHPAAYGVMHRKHHSHADTPEDPHSPVHLTNIISFNLSTVNEYRKLVNEFMSGERKSDDVPRWYLLEKIGESVITRSRSQYNQGLIQTTSLQNSCYLVSYDDCFDKAHPSLRNLMGVCF